MCFPSTVGLPECSATSVNSLSVKIITAVFAYLTMATTSWSAELDQEAQAKDTDRNQPNILFAIADDWGWPHASCYGDPVVKTPSFDKIAREGIRFNHAYVSSPSCTPSRGAILTGQWHWRLKGGANLFAIFPDEFRTYPEYLAAAGYETGRTGKAWGPGRVATRGRALAGKDYRNFETFLKQRDSSKPFCFWLGSSDPHRPYKKGSGEASGMELDKIVLAACFPDTEAIRSDVADYYFEVQRFDSLVGEALDLLEEQSLSENTIVVMTGDHGMPFPRCKSNLYDSGTRVPLAVRWPSGISKPSQTCDSFVSLTDLAPAFLAMAGLQVPDDMTGTSLLPLFQADNVNDNEATRDVIYFGKERHVPSQVEPDMGGYPCRAIRTADFLLIQNFRPDRWPNGTPDWQSAAIPGAWYADTDNGPTKTEMIERRDESELFQNRYRLAFGKRPEFELYDLRNDPDQLENVSGRQEYLEAQEKLLAQLHRVLIETKDPRMVESEIDFDAFPYSGGAPKHPDFRPTRK